MRLFRFEWFILPAAVASTWVMAPTVLAAQDPSSTGPAASINDMTGEVLYRAACANCHGADGTGVSRATVGFDVPLPDFTDCSFASREPTADWVAVAHEGGPVRGFAAVMPAFGDAVSAEQLQRVIDHVRGFCGNASWPVGELNMPRAMATEKAYPEDELVYTIGAQVDGPGSVTNEIVYERRFGARSQFEVVVPFAFAEQLADTTGGWQGGIGDIALGVKHALFHSARSGSILSLAAEVKLPTGSEERGFGVGTTVFEPFVSFGQLLPLNGFFQFQGVLEFPIDPDGRHSEGALRGVVGTTFTQGPWGRAWSPMVEVLAGREFESGAPTHWDIVPQFQVTLNTRQHVMANVALRIPVNDTETRYPRLLLYILWDWFDGGFFQGW
jgi:mono/diheme cytochrome c family protein